MDGIFTPESVSGGVVVAILSSIAYVVVQALNNRQKKAAAGSGAVIDIATANAVLKDENSRLVDRLGKAEADIVKLRKQLDDEREESTRLLTAIRQEFEQERAAMKARMDDMAKRLDAALAQREKGAQT